MLRHISDAELRLTVRLTPNASADRIQGIATAADGCSHLKVQVTAVPQDGKANRALLRLLAKAFRCPKTSLTIVSGQTDRTKVVAISGDPVRLEESIRAAVPQQT